MKNLERPLLVLFLVVITNYLAQIPYALYQYGGNVNPRGTLLLGMTLLWFLTGYWLVATRHAIGYWLLLAFLIVQFAFYFNNEILLMFHGYGLVYHWLDTRNMVVWTVELIGQVNFIVATLMIIYLLRNKSRLIGGRNHAAN